MAWGRVTGRRGLMAKSKTWDDAILAGHRGYLRTDSVRDAFDEMVAAAIDLPGIRAEPVWRKPQRIFTYDELGSGKRPFVFTVNRKDLLFRVLSPGLKSVPGGFAALKEQFTSAAQTARGEWTVRIGSKTDAERLNQFIFSGRSEVQKTSAATEKLTARTSDGGKSSEASHHWWVNHSKTFRLELDGGYLWSPKRNQKVPNSESYDNMTRLMPGDVVYSFADAVIRAVGLVLARAYEAPRPTEHGIGLDQGNNAPGWQVSVRFRELQSPLRPNDHAPELRAVLPKRQSPIRANGSENQGVYLAPVPVAMATILRRLLGQQVELAEGKIKESLGPQFSDDVEEARLQARADLRPAEKEMLIRARRGHGRYRQDLEKIETGCRLTGLIDRRHLRASHFKPWRVSNDDEKLDPNNGLLLSPHIHHLFDRGYISFTENGELLVSKYLNPVVLSDWGLTASIKPKPFNPKQRVYLDYHRTHVFQKHGRGKRPDERETNHAVHPSGDVVLREIVRGSG
jgi:putative restriction endonuclease